MAQGARLGVMITMVMAIGCSGGGESKSAATSSAATAPFSKPTPLPQPLETMIAAAAPNDFMTFAATQDFPAAGTTQATLPGAGSCAGQDVPIQITAVKHSSKLERKQDLATTNGYVLSKIENNTACQTTIIAVPPNGAVYWVARKDPTTKKLDSRIVGAAGDQTPKGLGFDECSDVHESPDDVSELRKGSDVCVKMGAVGAQARPRTDPNDWSLWIACSMGCCYTDRTGK